MKKALVVRLLFCAMGAGAQDRDWPRWRGPNGDGISQETTWDPQAISGGPRILWKMKVGAGLSNVVTSGDLLILESNTSGLALNCNTGEPVWKSKKPPKPYYQGGCSSGVDYATPAVFERDGKRYAIVGSYKGLFAVDVKTGRPLWVYDWEKEFDLAGDHITDPIIFDNKVFFVQFYSGSPGSALLDVSGKAPKVVWTNTSIRSETASPLYLGGRLYVCAGGGDAGFGALRCLDPGTGEMLWEEKLNGNQISLMAASGKLIALDETGTLFIGEPSQSGFKVISHATIPGGAIWRTSPVLCRGRLYCRDSISQLICIDMRKR